MRRADMGIEEAKIYWISPDCDEGAGSNGDGRATDAAERAAGNCLVLDAAELKRIYDFDFDRSTDAASREKSVRRDIALCQSLQAQGFSVVYHAAEMFPQGGFDAGVPWGEAVSAHVGTLPHAVRESGTKGTFYFVTGLSAAGKTTMGSMLHDRLKSLGRKVLLMDGDLTRAMLQEFDYTRSYRERAAYRDSRMCKLFTDQGVDVVSCGICMFHGLRKWHREHIPNYCEIYLDVPMSVLEQRDPKGLYAKARAGLMKDVVGVDQIAEFPETPDIRFVNDGTLPPREAFECIWAEIGKCGKGHA